MLRQFSANREQLLYEVMIRRVRGESMQSIARHLEVGYSTVHRILRWHQMQRNQGHDLPSDNQPVLPRASKLDPFVPLMQQTLGKYPDSTGQRINEELRDAGL
jgi:transposase